MSSATGYIRRAVLLAGFMSIALVPVFAQAGNGAPPRGQFGPPGGRGQFGPPPGGGLALERLGRELAFTDAQKTQVQTLLTAERTTLKPTFDSLRLAQQQLDAAIMQVPLDTGLLQAQVSSVSALQGQLLLAHAQAEAKIYQMLTADQQQKAQAFLAQMQQRMQEHTAHSGH